MAFNTYRCEQYIIYIKEKISVYDRIYTTILSAPFTTTQIGKFVDLNYFAIARKLKLRNLTDEEITKILHCIK